MPYNLEFTNKKFPMWSQIIWPCKPSQSWSAFKQPTQKGSREELHCNALLIIVFRDKDEDEEKKGKKKSAKERQPKQNKKEDLDDEDGGAEWEQVKKSSHSAVGHFRLFLFQ